MKCYEKIILVQLICKCLAAFAECFENGWSAFGTNCYKVIPTDDGINWFDAQKACERLGSNLVSIHDQSEQDYIFSLIKSTSFVSNAIGPWIGLNRTALHSETWQWSDGTSFDFSYWCDWTTRRLASGTAPTEKHVHNIDYISNTMRWNDIYCLADRLYYDGMNCIRWAVMCAKNVSHHRYSFITNSSAILLFRM